jgi:hypothetical protein
MAGMRPSVTVLEGALAPSPLQAAYDHFRLVLQGDLVSDRTQGHYDDMMRLRPGALAASRSRSGPRPAPGTS